ncbi:MAG: hypothetical protein QNJ84_11135 [Alphaproteobacteria bacterium]|nr:hypothetical protein [Alphaproteobacteria bacterium]
MTEDQTPNDANTPQTPKDGPKKRRGWNRPRNWAIGGGALALITVGALAAGGAAYADKFHKHWAGPAAERALQTIQIDDADGDGAVTKDEMRQGVMASIAANDADGDGALSLEEFEGVWLQRSRPAMEMAFEKLDVNADGSVSEAEALTLQLFLAERLDRNDDGVLSEEDIRKARHRKHHWRDGDDDDDS